MKIQKNTIALALIISSIILLMALQIFWITNSYEKAYFDLRRETNGLFRSTIMALRDSMLLKSFEQMPGDSLHEPQFTFTSRLDTSKNIKSRARTNQSVSQIQVFISADGKKDSIQTILRPLSKQMHDGKIRGGNFLFRMNSDSLSEDSIRHQFARALEIAGVPVRFEIKHSSFIPTPFPVGKKGSGTLFQSPPDDRIDDQFEPHAFSNKMYSDWIRFDPVHRYAVMLSDFRPLLIMEIAPQILFSIFLTILTSAAFVIMYRSVRAQQRLMELKNDFISNITHELKTPVTTVGVALEALKSFKGLDNPALTEEYLEIAQNELNRLNILTDKILKTSSFENNGVEYDAEPVELDKLVEQVLGSMKLVFEKQHAKITFTKEGSEFHLMGSTVHLTSVVYNLLDNALKYSREIPAIQVRLVSTADKLILTVKDHGIGISHEYKKKVFEKFFRVPTGDVHNIKGYGLGLSYVESVVKSHKGYIAVESEVGKGSVFTVTLPK
ncbi:MAG: GHKL domain-containing protein [Flammeovirgaceae bacterium]|nr:GHKL domain-containing protein [Flammeovirgaceae bacterium]